MADKAQTIARSATCSRSFRERPASSSERGRARDHRDDGEGAAAGGHVGVAAAGGALAHAGLLVFLAALVLGLSQMGVTPWLSALIISLLTIGIGYMLVNRGLTGLRSTSVAPTRAMESLKEDAKWTTRQGA